MTHKAVALFSGGLDSSLAARVVMEQGVEVTGFHLVSAFCRSTLSGEVHPDVAAAAAELGLALHCEDSTEDMLRMVRGPEHGFGKNLNPCLDCRINMLRRADRYRASVGADFLVSGEVLGQRPMSQNRNALELTLKRSGLEDRLLRPLSARLLEPTLPEREGWVDRESLPRIRGRSRKEQLALAARYGLTRFGAPGGGCLLTDAQYCRRLQDLLAEEEAAGRPITQNDLQLLRVGRHLRPDPRTRLVSGRDHEDNLNLHSLARPGDRLFQAVENPGSLVLLRPGEAREHWPLAAGLAVRYSRNREAGVADVEVRAPEVASGMGEVLPGVAAREGRELRVL
jgi:hypothetical protein